MAELRWSRHHVGAPASRLALLTGLAALLYLAAGVGMAYVAGFDAVRRAVENPRWPWLPASCGGVVVAHIGYYFAYRGIGKVECGPDELDTRSRLAVVVAGLGGFLAHGGTALDELVMRAAGASDREAKVRMVLLAGLEHGVLAIPCSAAAIAVLAAGVDKPPADFTLPWAIIPAVGFAVAFWAAERYRGRLRDRDGWHGRLGVLLDAIHLVRSMFAQPRRYWPALFGMLVFWLADMFALWVGMAAFRFHMNVGSLVVAFGTAMIVTRRTGPLGGAGLLGCALPPTLWISGAPWPAAVLGTFSYRFFTLWLPLPFSFLALPKLKEVVERAEERHDEGAQHTNEPALQR